MSLMHAEVFGPEMTATIEGMGLLAEQIADRWAGGWPEQTKKLMQENRLLEALESQANKEREMMAQASNMSYLAHHELMEHFGIEPNPPV